MFTAIAIACTDSVDEVILELGATVSLADGKSIGEVITIVGKVSVFFLNDLDVSINDESVGNSSAVDSFSIGVLVSVPGVVAIVIDKSVGIVLDGLNAGFGVLDAVLVHNTVFSATD